MTKIFALALALAFTAPLISASVASAAPTQQSTAQKVMNTYHTHFTSAE